ncbi:MAG: hypothetical protein ACOYO1_06900 [Bacteroidales bacterium]
MKINSIKILKYLPLILIGFIVIYNNINQTGCASGMGIVFFTIILASFYLIYLFVLFLINLYRIFKKNAKFDFAPTIITIFLLIILWIANQDFVKGKLILKANSINCKTENNLRISIELRSNNKCLLHFYHVDFGCTNSFSYVIKNDSLEIEKSVIELSDSMLTNKYYINRKEQILIPISDLQQKYLSFVIESNTDAK